MRGPTTDDRDRDEYRKEQDRDLPAPHFAILQDILAIGVVRELQPFTVTSLITPESPYKVPYLGDDVEAKG